MMSASSAFTEYRILAIPAKAAIARVDASDRHCLLESESGRVLD